jgi:hypothetical protein
MVPGMETDEGGGLLNINNLEIHKMTTQNQRDRLTYIFLVMQ